MHSCRRGILASLLMIVLAGTAAAQPVAVSIDATKVAPPISRWVFGGFMEPATTFVWAEMLADRKFFAEVSSKPPAVQTGGFGRRGPQRRWVPVGPDEFVTMDRKDAYVGEWSPLVRLDGHHPSRHQPVGARAARRPRLHGPRGAGGQPRAAEVSVSLIWGPNPGDRQTVSVRALTGQYAKVPLAFTAKADASDGRLEIVGTGTGTFHIGVVSLMPADNVSGFKAATITYLKELGIEMARWPGGNFVSAYDWRDGIGDRDRRPPRRELAWNGMESNDMGVDDFMTFCRLIGAEPYLAVNSGLGDAHSAAEEVEYVNGPATSRLGGQRAANGHPAPYGVKIWGVGNEMYGPWQWGHMSIRQYAGEAQPDGQGHAEGRSRPSR